MNSQYPSGICQICGCTQDDCTHCIERSGSPCSWTDDNETMCSTCQSYIDTLDQVGKAYERVGQVINQFIGTSQISRIEYENRTSVWKVYYIWDASGHNATAFASTKDLLIFLTADETGN